jgi:stage II sporulation protein D
MVMGALLLGGCKPRRGVHVTPQMDADPRFWIRVRLLDNIDSCVFQAPEALVITDPNNPSDQRVTLPGDSDLKAEILDGRITIQGQAFDTHTVMVCPAEPYVFELNGNAYRGRLRLVLHASGHSLDVVNDVPLEAYLAGVIGAEMPSYWEPEALKAQAIVARTYCLYIKERFGRGRTWDVSRTQAHQIYRGVFAESGQVWDAVYTTIGQVLMTEGPKGEEAIFPTYYCAICGGHTEDSVSVFGEASFGPLKGVPCPYCKEVATLGQFFWPMVQYDKAAVTQRLQQRYVSLKELGDIVQIDVLQQSTYDQFTRINRVLLTGATGRHDWLRAEDFRLALDPTGRRLRSTACEIFDWKGRWTFTGGRGWGHGVGMCQCGAQGMARQGARAKAILYHYYPGARLKRLY